MCYLEFAHIYLLLSMQCRYLHWVDSDCCAKKKSNFEINQSRPSGRSRFCTVVVEKGPGPHEYVLLRNISTDRTKVQ